MSDRRRAVGPDGEVREFKVRGRPVSVILKKWDGVYGRLIAIDESGMDISFSVGDIDDETENDRAWIEGYLLGSAPTEGEFMGAVELGEDALERASDIYMEKLVRYYRNGHLYRGGVFGSVPSNPTVLNSFPQEPQLWLVCGSLVLRWDGSSSSWQLADEQPDLDGPFLPGSECELEYDRSGSYHDFDDLLPGIEFTRCSRCGFIDR